MSEIKIIAAAQKRLGDDIEALAGVVAELSGSVEVLEQAAVDAATKSGRPNKVGGTDVQVTGYSAQASTAEDHAKAVEDLTTWLEWANPTLIVPRSTSRYGIPQCWPRHPGVVEELLALHAAWLAAYAEGPNDTMIAWHDRWLDSSVNRVLKTYTLSQCDLDERCQLDRRPVAVPPTTDDATANSASTPAVKVG